MTQFYYEDYQIYSFYLKYIKRALIILIITKGLGTKNKLYTKCVLYF